MTNQATERSTGAASFKEGTPEQRRAAAQVTKWMNSTRAQVKFCIQNFLPVSKSVAEDKELLVRLMEVAPS